MKIILTSAVKRGSYQIRAEAIHKFSELFDTQLTINKKVKDSDLKKADIIWIIKSFDEELAKRAKKFGKIVVFDPVDNFQWDADHCKTHSKYVDAIIAGSFKHKKKLEELSKKPVYYVQHHHSNHYNKVKQIDKIKTIGYLGQPFQFEIQQEIDNYCSKHNLKFFSKSPTKKHAEEAMKLDLFIIFIDLDKKRTKKKVDKVHHNYVDNNLDNILDFKPAQKFLLPLSVGVPCVSVPYSSYKDVTKEALGDENAYPFVNNKVEALVLMEKIRTNKQYRDELIAKGLRIANRFNVHMAVVDYFEVCNDLMSKKNKVKVLSKGKTATK